MQHYQIHCFSICHILLALLPWQPIRPGFSLPLKRESRKDFFAVNRRQRDCQTQSPSSYSSSPVLPTASGTDTSSYRDISRDISKSAEQLLSPVFTPLCPLYLITILNPSFFRSLYLKWTHTFRNFFLTEKAILQNV